MPRARWLRTGRTSPRWPASSAWAPTAVRWHPDSSSSRCAASASTATISLPPRPRPVQRRRWSIPPGRQRTADAALPLLVVDDTRLALGTLAAAWRARFAVPFDRRHRQQRQDHGQGDVRRHPACAGASGRLRRGVGAGHARQSEQRHRPAVDPARAARLSPRRGDRDGHEPSGRDRLSHWTGPADGGGRQ